MVLALVPQEEMKRKKVKKKKEVGVAPVSPVPVLVVEAALDLLVIIRLPRIMEHQKNQEKRKLEGQEVQMGQIRGFSGCFNFIRKWFPYNTEIY